MNSEQRTVNSEQFFECPECGLHYRDEELAKKCEAFCKEHKACSMEIAKNSSEEYKSREKRSTE